MGKIEELVAEFCAEHSLAVTVSHDMPEGYETAFGTYDVTENTLYLNSGLLERAPQWEVLYYVYHELRHAMQYAGRDRSSHNIQLESCHEQQTGNST